MNLEKLYANYNEEQRLFRGYASQIEYLTTLHYIYKYAKPHMRILEVGAGCGAYSLRLAKEGYYVTAIEPVKKHVQIMEAKKTDDMQITILQADAAHIPSDLNETFDMVLCFGPLYHIKEKAQQLEAIKNCCRACKKHGVLMFAYIPHDMVIASETFHIDNFLLSDEICQDSLKLKDDPIVFHDEQDIETLFQSFPLQKQNHIAVDGLAELMSERINNFTKQEFEIWFKYHLHTCEKASFLGHSNHNLLIFTKTTTTKAI